MPNNKEMELERQALLLEMAGKIDFIYKLLSAATIQNEAEAPAKEVKSERKTRKKTKKAE